MSEDQVSEIAKATKSAADAIKPVSETASSLANKLFGGPCEVIGGIATDQLQYMRSVRQVKLLEKGKRLLDDRKLTPRQLPPGFFIPFIDEAGNVFDDELQDMWAELLANGVEDDKNCRRDYVELLKQLTVLEARLLKLIASGKTSYTIVERKEADGNSFGRSEYRDSPDLAGYVEREEIGLSAADDFLVAVSKLESEGCLFVSAEIERSESTRRHEMTVAYRLSIGFSPVGAAFLAACTGQRPKREFVRTSWDDKASDWSRRVLEEWEQARWSGER